VDFNDFFTRPSQVIALVEPADGCPAGYFLALNQHSELLKWIGRRSLALYRLGIVRLEQNAAFKAEGIWSELGYELIVAAVPAADLH
jgi:hypothetical protein